MTRDWQATSLLAMRPQGWDESPVTSATTTDTTPILLVRRGVLSPQLRNYRDIVVAMPASAATGTRRYPVVYLQDGQNLFDDTTSYVEPWGLLDQLGRLAATGHEAIIVGVPNSGRFRRYEYSPFRDIIHGGGGGDRYLAFLMETVKALVDRDFPTDPRPETTILGGSSLGALISTYGACRHPDVFGGALIQSPALWFADAAILGWLATRHRPARVHLDVGTDEGEEAVEDVRRLRDLWVAQGAVLDADLSYLEEEGADHHEHAWARRFELALPFLLKG